MGKMWFLYSNDVVTGPFATDELRKRAVEGQVPPNSFVWWKGQREWMALESWLQSLDTILIGLSSPSQKAVWYLDMGTAPPVGPLTQADLIESLKLITDLNPVKVWAVGMPKWKTVFETPEILEQLGMSRREVERAPLMGTVAITRPNEDPKGFVVKAASISIGGVGVSDAKNLLRGDEVAVLIKSKEIPGNLHLHGEVVYVTANGDAGIRFQRVHPEMLGLIHDYIKRFHQNASGGTSKDPGSSAA